MSAAKIAGLTFIPAGVVGLTQFHYVVSHLSQIATGATAIGLGVAVWGGHSVIGKVKLRNTERKEAKAAAVESSAVDERIAALAEAMSQRPAVGQRVHTGQVIDFTQQAEVSRRV